MHWRLLIACAAVSARALAQACPACDGARVSAELDACVSCNDAAGVGAFQRWRRLDRGSTAESEALLEALASFAQVIALDPANARGHCARVFILERLRRHRDALLARHQCKREQLAPGPADDPAQMGAASPAMQPDPGSGTLDIGLAKGARRVAVRRSGEPWWYFYDAATPSAAVALTLDHDDYELRVEWEAAAATEESVSIEAGGTATVTLAPSTDDEGQSLPAPPSRLGVGVQASAVVDEDFGRALAATGGAHLLIGLDERWSLQLGGVAARRSAGGQVGAIFRLLGPLQVEGGSTLLTNLSSDERSAFWGGYLGPRVNLGADWAYAGLTAQYFVVASGYDPFFLLVSFGLDGRSL